MTVIVAGTFDSKSSVDAAITTLRRAGFREDEFNSFFGDRRADTICTERAVMPITTKAPGTRAPGR